MSRRKMGDILKSRATKKAKRTGSLKEQAKVIYRQMKEVDRGSKSRDKYQHRERY